jgi:hypothetical protein
MMAALGGSMRPRTGALLHRAVWGPVLLATVVLSVQLPAGVRHCLCSRASASCWLSHA